MSNFVTTDEIQTADKIHPVDFLESMGESIVNEGQKYFRHAEHDSLIINDNGKWFWNSRQVGGFGSISLARELYGLKFPDAVKLVNQLEINPTFQNEREKEKEIKPFVYPIQYEVGHLENATNYLTKERLLDEKIVLALKKHNLIAEDRMKNIIFKWKDREGNIVGADRQGTQKMDSKRGTFKGIIENSTPTGTFKFDVGTPERIAFFESPIDALSYFDLKRPNNIRLCSMSGLKNESLKNAVKELHKDFPPKNSAAHKIILAVDNDKAGNGFIEQHWGDFLGNGIVETDRPKNKDWNDDLKEVRLQEIEKNQKLDYQNFQSKQHDYEFER